MKSYYLLLFIFCACFKGLYAQEAVKSASLELQAGFTSNDAVPLWLRSNQYGSVPLAGASTSLLAKAGKSYAFQDTVRWQWDWKAEAEARLNIGNAVKGQLIVGYAAAKLGIFEILAGRTKEVMGLNGDTLLSSGNFAVSGNALGIPKIQLSIPDYWRIPIWEGLISIKGNFNHGWIGKALVHDGLFADKTLSDHHVQTFFHQKSLYGRIGRSRDRLQLYGGFNHQVYWGNEREVYGEKYDLSNVESFFYAVTGKAYGGNGSGIPRSKLGNQGGSIDLGASFDFSSLRLMAYRQNFYDVGALAKLANIKDGLNGISLENLDYNRSHKASNWKKILVEFFYSKDQAGYPWSKATKSGDENYYNNYYYKAGHAYRGVSLGSPLITEAYLVKNNQAHDPEDFFSSNRVVAAHLGFIGKVSHIEILSKVTYAKHYGAFNTSEYGGSLGKIFRPPAYGIFKPVNQFSFYIQADKSLKNNVQVGATLATDQGDLLHNSFAAQLRIRKSW